MVSDAQVEAAIEAFHEEMSAYANGDTDPQVYRAGWRAALEAAERAAWRPISEAPRDGTWILGLNNRGNQAVIIWKESAPSWRDPNVFSPGWIHPFSYGVQSSFWNGACGSVATHFRLLPQPPVT